MSEDRPEVEPDNADNRVADSDEDPIEPEEQAVAPDEDPIEPDEQAVAPDEDPVETGEVETGPSYCPYTDYGHGVAVEDLPATGADAEGVAAAVWDELRAVEDPEMPVSVVDLGLIYDVTVEDGAATVTMTLTYTGCPARDYLQADVRQAAARADGVKAADVKLVWTPEWNLEMVTEAGKADLREFGVSV